VSRQSVRLVAPLVVPAVPVAVRPVFLVVPAVPVAVSLVFPVVEREFPVADRPLVRPARLLLRP